MKVLSLFDGMACGALALQVAGIEIESYDAFEIDKYAVQTSAHNFPFIKQHGDVFKADFTQFKGVDLVCGGSPCTYWSIAQKNNREIEASGMGWELFQQFVRAIREAEPKYFVYENNKSMSKQIRASIDEAFGFEAVLINSALVSAQNRQRLYWVGKRNADGTYSKVDIEQPQNKGILLKDILETGGDLTSNNKAYALTASYNGAVAWNTIERNQRNMVAEPVNTTLDEKSQTIKATYNFTSISNICCFSSTYGSTGIATPTNEEPSEQFSGSGKDRDAMKRVYEVKDGKITIKGKQYPIKLADGYYIIRKLTVRECMRLQTVPEWYEFPVSNAQAYKMLGNGWTVDVIAHIFTALKEGANNE